jgi:hypothetical protein
MLYMQVALEVTKLLLHVQIGNELLKIEVLSLNFLI